MCVDSWWIKLLKMTDRRLKRHTEGNIKMFLVKTRNLFKSFRIVSDGWICYGCLLSFLALQPQRNLLIVLGTYYSLCLVKLKMPVYLNVMYIHLGARGNVVD
jgi:hypothetical protein